MISLREAFGRAIVELAEKRDDFWILDADVAGGTFTHWFRERFPDRFVQCGIAEQNMMAAAAGISTLGVIPIVTCYAVFASMRAIEQARNMVAYGNFNVKVVASHVGVDVGPDGATHQAIEDLAIYRSIPNFVVLSPADDVELKVMLSWMLDYRGPVYMRTGRSPVPRVHHGSYTFKLGEPELLFEPERTDVVVFATGITVHRALNVAERLLKQGIGVRVVNVATLKPVKPESFVPMFENVKVAVSIEDHNIIGGLGSLISEIAAEKGLGVKTVRLGICDRFGKSGNPEELAEVFGIGEKSIEAKLKELLKE